MIQSRVREAASIGRQADFNTAQVRRLASQEVQIFFENLKADQAQVKTLTKAYEISERNYKQTLRDYRLGLTTNIDVVQSLTQFQSSKRALDRAKLTEKFDRIQLETVSGQRLDFLNQS